MPASKNSPWTETIIGELKTRTERGEISSYIAIELNKIYRTSFTRNAIIGKQNRLGFVRQNDVTGRLKASIPPKTGSPAKPKPRRSHRFRNVIKANGHREKPTFYAVNRQVEVLNISFADIDQHQCHWCCEGRDEWGPLRCGQLVVFGTKWCPGHARIVYTEGSHEYARAGNLQRTELSQTYPVKPANST